MQNISTMLCQRVNFASLCMKRNHLKLNEFIMPYSTKSTPEVPTNVLKDLHASSSQTELGVIYDKKPFKMVCEPGKQYFWCSCGNSKSQPLCDGTHKSIYLKIKMRPVKFAVTEKKEYWLCNCKQTSNRPFCDGTHKREDIQAAIKS